MNGSAHGDDPADALRRNRPFDHQPREIGERPEGKDLDGSRRLREQEVREPFR